MKNFSTVCKGAFKKILIPQGYTNWRSFFYRADSDLFFLINGRRAVATYSPAPTHIIELSIGALPYCQDLETSFYKLSDGILSFESILRRLTIDKMSKAEFTDYINELTDAKDEEVTCYNFYRNTLP